MKANQQKLLWKSYQNLCIERLGPWVADDFNIIRCVLLLPQN